MSPVRAKPKFESISISGTAVTLTWSAIAGVSYRVEFKNSLSNSTWDVLNSNITASGSAGTFSDEGFSGDAQRYYRITAITE